MTLSKLPLVACLAAAMVLLAAKGHPAAAALLLAAEALPAGTVLAAPQGMKDDAAAAAEIERLSDEAVDLYGRGRYEEALPPAEKALELSRKVFGDSHEVTARSMNNLAQVRAALGDSGKAEQLLLESIRITEKVSGSGEDLVPALRNLASLYSGSSKLEKAGKTYRRLIDILEDSGGGGPEALPQAYGSLAGVLEAGGRLEEALQLREKALRLLEAAHGQGGAEGPGESLEAARRSVARLKDNIAATLNNRGVALARDGKKGEAIKALEKALGMREELLGPDDPRTLATAKNLSIIYLGDKRNEKAEPLLRRLYEAAADSLGGDDPRLLPDIKRLARINGGLKRYADAARFHDTAVAILEKAPDGDRRDLVMELYALGGVYVKSDRYADAAGPYWRAAGLIDGGGLAEDGKMKAVLTNLLQFFRQTGDEEKTAAIEKMLGIEPDRDKGGEEED